MHTGYRRAAAGMMGCLLVGGALGMAQLHPEPVRSKMPGSPPLFVRALPAVEPVLDANNNFVHDLADLPMNHRTYITLAVAGSPRETTVEYTIKNGDTLWDIAEANGTDVETLERLNPDLDAEALQPDQTITIAGTSVASTDRANPKEQVAEVPRIARNQVASRGDSTRTAPADQTAQTAVATTQSAPAAPAKAQASVQSGFIWPITGGLTTDEFGSRWGGFHSGLDIAVPTGTPAHAVKSGVVIFSGWDAGFGYCVKIDHGDGVVTRYAHASAILVTKGQKVQQGDTVIRVGNTGNSTGPHLHFEVIVDGTPQNPRNYLPR